LLYPVRTHYNLLKSPLNKYPERGIFMSKTVEQILNDIIDKEGGWVNHPDDRGGPTNWGITLAVFREVRPNATIEQLRALTKQEAFEIYRTKYYITPRFDLIFAVSPKIAAELTDTGVNMGVSVASRFIQRSLNLFNDSGRAYSDLVVDGRIGQTTANALRTFIQRRGSEGEKVLLNTLNVLQSMRYIEITEARQQNESFIYGWMLNRVSFIT
jgi:lysozyme family protein